MCCHLGAKCYTIHFFIKNGTWALSKEVHKVSVATVQDFTQQIKSEYRDLFANELGKLPVTYSMTLDPEVRPVVRPAHCIPVTTKDQVKAELDRMQELGVITPISEPPDWVSSMVATNKKDKKEIRMCINPKHGSKKTT